MPTFELGLHDTSFQLRYHDVHTAMFSIENWNVASATQGILGLWDTDTTVETG